MLLLLCVCGARCRAEAQGRAVRNPSVYSPLCRTPEGAQSPLPSTDSGKRGEVVDRGSPGGCRVAGISRDV